MPLYYLDTSALVKRYVNEDGSLRVQALCASQTIAISWLALVELASALATKTHQGDLTVSRRDELVAAFLQDAREYLVLPVSEDVIQEAADLVIARPSSVRLRSLDALHLVSAKRAFALARELDIALGTFVTADRRLMEAADWAIVPAENPEDFQG